MTNQAIYILGREKCETIEDITTTHPFHDGYSISARRMSGARVMMVTILRLCYSRISILYIYKKKVDKTYIGNFCINLNPLDFICF